MITVATARRRLRAVEAELIESLSAAHRSVTEEVTWRIYDSRRLTRVIDAKASILDTAGSEVSINAVCGWFDLVVDEIINRTARDRVLGRTASAPELLDPAARKRARRSLGLNAGFTAALSFAIALVACAGMAFFGLVYPVARAALTPYPDIRDALGSLALAALAPLATAIVSSAWQAYRKRS